MPASLTHVAVGPCAVAPCLLSTGHFPFAPRRRALHSTMASQPPRRERASSDRAQAQAVPSVPQRPGLQSRTISAPVGGLYKLDTSRLTVMDNGHKVDRAVLEEDEFLSSPARNGVSSPRGGDEVRPSLNSFRARPVLVGNTGSAQYTNRSETDYCFLSFLCDSHSRSQTSPTLPLPLSVEIVSARPRSYKAPWT